MSPGEVCTFIKREMGSENYRFSCSKGSYRPEQVSACILRKLVNDASERLGQEIQDVVITCPAYFSHQEREATKAAGRLPASMFWKYSMSPLPPPWPMDSPKITMPKNAISWSTIWVEEPST